MLIDSSYTVGSDPNTMRNLAIFSGGPVNLQQAVDFSGRSDVNSQAVPPSTAASSQADNTSSVVQKKVQKKIQNRMQNIRRLYKVQ